MSGAPLLFAEDVHQTYSVSRGLFRGYAPLRALRGVTLELRKGEVLGVVGESGCGKSTLSRILLGLEEPTAGQVLLDGKALNRVARLERTRRIQPVFQDPYSSLNPRKRVASLIALPLRAHRIGTARDQLRQVEEMAELVGLPRRVLQNPPNELSGGQRQRVAIARALIMRPDIVICDEPTSALDVSVQAQILNLLRDLQSQLNLTYVLISHNLAVVEFMATRVAVMYAGRIVEQGDSEVIFSRPCHPYTRTLLNSVLTPDPALGLPDAVVDGGYPSPTAIPSGCSFHPRCPEATATCRSHEPVLVDEAGRRVECHLYGGSPEGAEPVHQSRWRNAGDGC
jgi:peptide/nickel transport system ATP-binding protein